MEEHWEHVRTIRVPILGDSDCERISRLLDRCVNLHSLALYFHSESLDTTAIAASVVKLMENG
jgi:hypothetical protein